MSKLRTVYVTEEVHRELKALSAQKGLSMGEMVKEMLEKEKENRK